jgi:hypothetical protein
MNARNLDKQASGRSGLKFVLVLVLVLEKGAASEDKNEENRKSLWSPA